MTPDWASLPGGFASKGVFYAGQVHFREGAEFCQSGHIRLPQAPVNTAGRAGNRFLGGTRRSGARVVGGAAGFLRRAWRAGLPPSGRGVAVALPQRLAPIDQGAG